MNFFKSKIFIYFIKYAFAALVLIYFFKNIDIEWTHFSELINPKVLVPLLFIRSLMYMAVSWRWRVILKEFHLDRPLWRLLSLNLMSLFMSYLVPGSVTSDLGKAYFAKNEKVKMSIFFTSIMLDRVIGLLSLIFIFLGAFIYAQFFAPEKSVHFAGLLQKVPWTYVFLSLIVMAGLVLSLVYVFAKKSLRFQSFLCEVKKMSSPLFWIKTVAISLVVHSLWIYFFIQGAQALKLSQIDGLGTALIFPIATLALIVPLTPASFGVGQYLYQTLFNLYSGSDLNQGAIAFTTVQVLDLFFVCIGCIFFLKQLLFRRAKNDTL